MSINFTGIKNINLAEAKYRDFGVYLNRMNEVTQGERYNKIVSLTADLDDTVMSGEDIYQKNYRPHMRHYLDALQKLNDFEKFKNILGSDPKKMNIVMMRQYVPDNLGSVSNAVFTINGQSIPLTNRNVLPLYTFMARVTRDILKLVELPERARKSIKLMNNSISKEAAEFIENM